MIGLFINNLVVRTQILSEQTFSQLLSSVRKKSVQIFAHDQVPFEFLVSQLKPERKSGMAPFFQHFFIHRNIGSNRWTLPGLDVEPMKIARGGSKFDITLSVLEDDDKISGTLEYATDLFERSSMERMAANYIELLSSIAANPDQLLSELSIIAPNERQQLLHQWNPPATDYPKQSCTFEVFQQQVIKTPDAIAVNSEQGDISYADLNAKANRLAQRLRAEGVKRDTLVGVCLERSEALIVSLLAVWKAGGAYVPLDPYFPADRLTYMVEDSQAPIIISQSGIAEKFSESEALCILVDVEQAQAEEKLDADLETANHPDDLAYVIYTSGSTGKPKGVQLSHRSLVNFLCSMQKQPGIKASDSLLALTTICFDIAALEIFLPLLFGARVVIRNRETSMLPDRIVATLEDQKVTIMQATPVTWRMLIEHGWQGEPKIKILCGGEAMGLDLAENLLATGCEVWNLYGPTETTIWSSVKQVCEKETRCMSACQ
jgi:Non-ribosomal peptide synthetase modules and related proteins